MKVVAIQSSMRKKSNTRRLVEAALEGAREAGVEVEMIELSDYRVEYCSGCVGCYRTGRCHIEDDYSKLKEKLVCADGVILSSPNYVSNINAPLKAVLDRSPNFIHERYLEGKYAFSIMTADAGDEKLLLDMMNGFLMRSGARVIGGMGHMMMTGPEGMEASLLKAKDMGRELAEAIASKREYPEQAKESAAWKEMFAGVLKMNRESWKHNYEHWARMGWIVER